MCAMREQGGDVRYGPGARLRWLRALCALVAALPLVVASEAHRAVPPLVLFQDTARTADTALTRWTEAEVAEGARLAGAYVAAACRTALAALAGDPPATLVLREKRRPAGSLLRCSACNWRCGGWSS